MFKAPFSFIGRIRRLEYGLSCLIFLVLNIIYLSSIQLLIKLMEENNFFSLITLLHLPLYWFLLAQGSKRCHDRGNGGWWQLIPFYFVIMLFYDGEKGKNEYGLNPKGLSLDSEIEDIGME